MALARFFFDNDSDFDRMLSARLPPWYQSGVAQGGTDRWTPKFDIVQKDVRAFCFAAQWPSTDVPQNNVVVFAELPGVEKEDVKLDLSHDGRLTISGTTKEEKEYEDEAHVTHKERSFGAFTRSISVPSGIKSEDIKASMENGLLKVVLPTKPKEPTSKQITIE
jgi:HSP20 family protein